MLKHTDPRTVVRKLRSAFASLGLARRDGPCVPVNDIFDDDLTFMVNRFKDQFGVPKAEFQTERGRREGLRCIFDLLHRYGFEGRGEDGESLMIALLFLNNGPLSEKQGLTMNPAFSRAIEELKIAWMSQAKIEGALGKREEKRAEDPATIENAFLGGIEALVATVSEPEPEPNPDPVLVLA